MTQSDTVTHAVPFRGCGCTAEPSTCMVHLESSAAKPLHVVPYGHGSDTHAPGRAS